MVVNLIDQPFWKWFVVCEPSEKCHPVVKFCASVDRSHPFIIIRDDLNEGTHNMREEHDTNHHDQDTNEHLWLRNRI